LFFVALNFFRLYLNRRNPNYSKLNIRLWVPFAILSYPLQDQKTKQTQKKSDQRSPYLKAILTGNRSGTALIRSLDSHELSDRNAASRYIKETSFLRKA
jgi:hypothetical protein